MSFWIRRTHRWLAVVFTLTVIANLTVMGFAGQPPAAIVYAPLPPLFLMLFTGLWMLVQPLLRRRAA